MSKIVGYRVSAAVVLALCMSAQASAQPSLTASGFMENFDSMGQDGITPPNGWTTWTIPGSNTTWQPVSAGGVGIPPDQMSPETSTLGTPTQRGIDPDTPLTAWVFPSFGAGSNHINGWNAASDDNLDDRALAGGPTGVAGTALELVLANNSGSDIASLAISYDIRSFQVGAGGADELPGFWLFYSLDGGVTYTNVSDLNPDGNSVPNISPNVTHIPMDLTGSPTYVIDLSATPLTAGSNINFCWVDDNGIASSPDQIIGLDNVIITIP
jgi:hypothetical protein